MNEQKKDWILCYDTIAHAAKSIGVTLHLKSIPEAKGRELERFCIEFNMERLELSPRRSNLTYLDNRQPLSHVCLQRALAIEYGIKMETGYIVDQPETDRVYLRYAKFTKIEPARKSGLKSWNFKEEVVEPTFQPSECREGHHVADLSCQTKILTVGEVTARPHVDSPLGFACQCVAKQLIDFKEVAKQLIDFKEKKAILSDVTFHVEQRRCKLNFSTMEMSHGDCVGEHSHERVDTRNSITGAIEENTLKPGKMLDDGLRLANVPSSRPPAGAVPVSSDLVIVTNTPKEGDVLVGPNTGRRLTFHAGQWWLDPILNVKAVNHLCIDKEEPSEHAKMVDFFTKDSREKK